ncbi:MAG: hypothetical protein GVY29_06325 [Spirochaetes bacterium]|jgi:uncharacterized integral membrane protein|nr:hypothetical protein [Spirochaetota bacterium]
MEILREEFVVSKGISGCQLAKETHMPATRVVGRLTASTPGMISTTRSCKHWYVTKNGPRRRRGLVRKWCEGQCAGTNSGSAADIAWSMLVGALILAPSLFIFGPGEIAATVHYPALGVTLPVVAAFLGYLIFGEVPASSMIYGGILLLGSGFWLTWEMSHR